MFQFLAKKARMFWCFLLKRFVFNGVCLRYTIITNF